MQRMPCTSRKCSAPSTRPQAWPTIPTNYYQYMTDRSAPCAATSVLLRTCPCCCAAAAADHGRTCCTGAWLCCLPGPAVIGRTLPPALPLDCALLLLPRLLTTSLMAAAKLLSLVDGLAPATCIAVLPQLEMSAACDGLASGLPASASSARAMIASSSSCKVDCSCLRRLFSCFTAISCLRQQQQQQQPPE
jgi:hypothetical protein